MQLYGFSKSFWTRALFILLTVVSLGAQAADSAAPGTAAVDRRAYAQAAYEGFIGALNFLAASDPFMSQLNPAERAQFQVLGEAIIQNSVLLGPGPTPGDGNTSAQLKTKLHFSDNNQDFIIPPDKIVRTAKMDGDIWFNLNMINDPKSAFNLLDAFQIMYHEFGHTLQANKNQQLIDQIAAKMKIYLAGFYKETAITPELKAKTLILPYLMLDAVSPIDLQMEPIVLFDLQGKAVAAKLNVPGVLSPGQRYIPQGYKTQTFNRLTLTPKFSAYQNNILVEWFVETKNYYVNSTHFNYMDLYTNNEKVAPVLPLETTVAYKRTYQTISPQDLMAKLPQAHSPLASISLKNYAEAPVNYSPAVVQNWVESLQVKETKNGRIWLEATVQSPEEIKEVIMQAQLGNSALEIPGQVEKLTANYFRLLFSVPENSAAEKNLYVTGIGINSKTRWDLEARMTLPLKTVAAPKPVLQDVQVWNDNRWQGIRQITSEAVNADQVKMRFLFANAPADMNHLEINWIIQENIFKGSENNGARFRNHVEVIAKENLIQSRKDGVLSVEFTSKKASNYLPIEYGKDGFTAQDQGVRGMASMLFVDQNLNTLPIPTRLVQNGWKSAFILTKPRPAVDPLAGKGSVFEPKPLCQKVF